jgi:ABC-type multidrug transport system fused ATPase/permease subunit
MQQRIVRHADRIYVMKDGRIIEEGTHDALLHTGGVYRMMWNAQALKYAN